MSASGPAVFPEEHQVARALARAAAYRLLGGAWAYPAPSCLADLAALGARLSNPERAPSRRGAHRAPRENLDDSAGEAGLLGACRHFSGTLLVRTAAEAWPLAPLFLAFAEAAREATPETTAEEYVFLFDREARCPPYEGAWGDAPQLAGKSALLADIAGFYAAFGLEPSAARPDTEDHVALECEFMSVLCLKEAYALAEGMTEALEVTRAAQARFLADHLGRWGEIFADSVKKATRGRYYGALASLLAAWLGEETTALGVEPAPSSGREGCDPVHEEAFTCPMAPAPFPEDGEREPA